MQRTWRRNWEKRKQYHQSGLKKVMRSLVVVGLAFSMTTGVSANPTGGTITAGTGSITDNGKSMTIQQNTDKLAINWDSFSIGAGEIVNFIQPGKQSVALNRVIGSEASHIFGSLTSNGKVFLINPNGVLFAPGATVNVGGLVASTSNISDADFLAENYAFQGGQGGAVINGGNIMSASNVELFGAVVSNQGIIVARDIENNKGTIKLVGNSVDLEIGSWIYTTGDVLLRAGADGTGINTVTVANGTIDASQTAIYYNPITYDDNQSKTTTSSNPYTSLLPGTKVTSYMLVNSLADFKNIGLNRYGVYALNNDIGSTGDKVDFGVPISNFSGILDGEGHSISGVIINGVGSDKSGLFANTSGAVIRNLDLFDVSVTGNDTYYVGTLAAYASRTTFENITVRPATSSVMPTVTATRGYAGGVVGYMDGGKLVNIQNHGDVSGKDVGGIVGRASGATMENVYQSGVVTGSAYAGGIAGYVDNSNLMNLQNDGDVSGKYAGGIVGNASYANIRDAHQSATITGSAYAGGIAGSLFVSSVYNSENKGVVSGGSDSYVGGIAGKLIGLSYATGGIYNSKNRGHIKADQNSTVGGIVGYGDRYIQLTDIGNTGLVELVQGDIGGIIGRIEYGSIRNAINEGAIIAGDYSNSGGIAGNLIKSEISYSNNHGLITSGDGGRSGGIAGASFNGIISTVWNYHNVLVGLNSYAGGITGGNSGKIYNAKNGGNLAAKSGQVGGISGSNWGSDAIISNSHNYGFFSVLGKYSHIGGVAGSNGNGASISNSSNFGLIHAPDSNSVGNIVGWLADGSIN